MTKIFAVSLEVAGAILDDPVFNAKLGNAKTWLEVEAVLKEFAEKKELKVQQ